MLKYSQHAKVSVDKGQVGAALGYFGFALEFFIGQCVIFKVNCKGACFT
jgi:hypothetical protein